MRFLGLAVIFGLLLSTVPVQASVLEYHRAVLQGNNGNAHQRLRIANRAPKPKVTTKTDIRSRLVSRLAALRQAKVGITNIDVEKKAFTADALDFRIIVPSDFTKDVDTLSNDSGVMILRRANGDEIRIRATQKVCEGGFEAFFNCFRTHWQTEQARFSAAFGPSVTLENEDYRWRNDFVSAQQQRPNNTGRYLILEAGTERMAQFLFLAPKPGTLWEVEMRGKTTDSILADSNGAKRLLLTMFGTEAPDQTSVRDRLKLNLLKSQQNRFSIRSPRTTKTLFSSKDVTEISADGLNFSLEVPRSYAKAEDSLAINDGVLVIEDRLSESTIRIMATEDLCNSQTDVIEQACIRETHEALQKDFAADKGDVALLIRRNYDLQLTPESFNDKDYGAFSLFRSTNKNQRHGLLTWREPGLGHIWHAEIFSPEDNNALLSNQQRLNAMITSLIFLGE